MVCAAVETPGPDVEGIKDRKKWKKWERQVPSRHPAAATYMEKKGCRREIIDQATDGFVGREGSTALRSIQSIAPRLSTLFQIQLSPREDVTAFLGVLAMEGRLFQDHSRGQ
jgi:hypothetical protein